VTNLEKKYVTMTALDLAEQLQNANKENMSKMSIEMPKYKYPDEVLTAAAMSYIGKHGVELKIKKSDAAVISDLDAMKEQGKTPYGGALLLSEKAAAEKAAAEKAAAEKAAAEKAAAIVWELSEREKEIVRKLGGE
jgi:hypothetical protein